MTDLSVRLSSSEPLTKMRGTLPDAPLAMPSQRLESDANWLREALVAPLRMFQPRSREV